MRRNTELPYEPTLFARNYTVHDDGIFTNKHVIHRKDRIYIESTSKRSLSNKIHIAYPRIPNPR